MTERISAAVIGTALGDAAAPFALPARVSEAVAGWMVGVDAALEGLSSDTERVRAVAALLAPLTRQLPTWMDLDVLPVHPDGYQRVCLGCSERTGVSIYAMSWLAEQVTEIHDHGTWGAVGVVRGALREVRYDRPATGALIAGDPAIYAPGTVATFVEEPMLIHEVTALPVAARTTSLHVYGADISGFHVYDEETGLATWVDVETHNEPD